MRKIQIFDATGKVLATAEAKSNAKRISVRAAADQRQIDTMYVPGAVTATLGNAKFRFDAKGRSQFEF